MLTLLLVHHIILLLLLDFCFFTRLGISCAIQLIVRSFKAPHIIVEIAIPRLLLGLLIADSNLCLLEVVFLLLSDAVRVAAPLNFLLFLKVRRCLTCGIILLSVAACC